MSKLSLKNINLVKNFLINHYKVNTWEECVDNMNYGDCKKICKLIVKQFPNMFDKYLINVVCDFSDQAIELINDDGQMYGNHYLLSKGNNFYDFSRGSNCINGIYVLTQNNNKDKYDVEFTDKEKDQIEMLVRELIK